MKKPVFVGSAVALITPFNEGGVDTKKLKALIDFHLAHKTDAIVVAATTGEAEAYAKRLYEDATITATKIMAFTSAFVLPSTLESIRREYANM